MDKSLLELERMTNDNDGITVIVPTSVSPLWLFQLMLLSLYFRTDWTIVRDVVIVVNGRGPEQQAKRAWLQRMYEVGLMPMTVVSVENRVGHSAALDCGLPWVQTGLVASFHDDVLIENSAWASAVRQVFRDQPDVGMLVSGWCGFDGQSPWEGKTVLHKRHPATDFTFWRKDAFTQAGALWRGYHAPVSGGCVISNDVGYWAVRKLTEAGWQVQDTPSLFHKHFVAGSWSDPAHLRGGLERFATEIRDLEHLIAEHSRPLGYVGLPTLPATISYDQMVQWHDAHHMHLHQNFYEFREWLRLLEQLQPSVLLEIGTYKWGTAEMVLRAIPSIRRLVTVDIVDRLAERPDMLSRYNGRLAFVQGNTQEAGTWARIAAALGEPADVAFIDGDHDYRPTLVDLAEAQKLVKTGGTIGIHDVHPDCGQIGSVVAFKELLQLWPNKAYMIECAAEGGPWQNYGIGVYRCV